MTAIFLENKSRLVYITIAKIDRYKSDNLQLTAGNQRRISTDQKTKRFKKLGVFHQTITPNFNKIPISLKSLAI